MKTLLLNCQTSKGVKNILIKDELIDYIGSEKPVHDKMLDCSGLLVIPGMIDPHVHVRDMEMAYKETWETASKAAIAGGVTTIIDMPNTKPATINLKGLNAKREAAKKANVNYKFHLGATENNLQELKQILENNPTDIAGIKVFLAGSSSNEVVADENKLKEIFKLAKKYDKVVLVHTELQSCLDKWSQKIAEKTIQNHDMIRNRECAIKGTKLVLKLANEIGNKLYICHVSTKEEIDLIRIAKQESKNIFCEITPHHLILDKSILEQVGNFGKVNPPFRTEEDNQTLLKAVIDGTIDCVGSDHAPHTIAEKQQDYSKALSGFPGLETAIPMTYFLVKEKHISLKSYSELISGNAAEIFNLEKRGEIKVGNFADLNVIDPDEECKIEDEKFETKAKYSPFERMKTGCEIVMCFVNGEKMKEEPFYTVKKFSNWDEIKNYVNENLSGWIFRGQADSCWKLEPTIERIAKNFQVIAYENFEMKIYNEFIQRGQNYIEDFPDKDDPVECFSFIQHYGGCTRFLDFTKSFYIATFFALENLNNESSKPVIWAINHAYLIRKMQNVLNLEHKFPDYSYSDLRNELNDLLLSIIKKGFHGNYYIKEENGIKIKRPKNPNGIFCIEPNKFCDRMDIQQGMFLVPANSDSSFEENLKGAFCQDFIKESIVKIHIDNSLKLRKEILLDLKKMNISIKSLFPGKEGFIRNLKFNFLENVTKTDMLYKESSYKTEC